MKKSLLGALVVGTGLAAVTVGLAAPASAWPDAPHMDAPHIGDVCHDPNAHDFDPWGTPIVCVDPDPHDMNADLFWVPA